jgi:hypothetical protein
MKPTSRYKRNLLIAATSVICAVVVYLLWSRSNVLPRTLGASQSTYLHSLAARALSADERIATLPKFPPPAARENEPGWEALLKKITTLLSG